MEKIVCYRLYIQQVLSEYANLGESDDEVETEGNF